MIIQKVVIDYIDWLVLWDKYTTHVKTQLAYAKLSDLQVKAVQSYLNDCMLELQKQDLPANREISGIESKVQELRDDMYELARVNDLNTGND
jgi:hypothetical protein